MIEAMKSNMTSRSSFCGRRRTSVEKEKMYKEAKKEAKNAFGDDRIYIEKFIEKARHIEVQVVGDGQGHAVHLYERDCSIQKKLRHVFGDHSADLFCECRLRIPRDC